MKQNAFDNILKLMSILMFGYFLFLMSRMTEPKDSSDGGRYKFIDKENMYILDSKTGYLYPYDDRIKK